MKQILSLCRGIDWVSDRIGKAIGWLLLAAVVISAGNAVIRKAFDLSSNAFLEAQWYLFAAVFMLGAGYVFLTDQHVRIDVLSNKLSRRSQIWIDVVGIAMFLIPLCIFVMWTSLPSVLQAMETDEVSANAGGLLRWPLYILVPIGFALLALQSVSELFKRIAYLTGQGPDPHAKADKTAEEILAEELLAEEIARENRELAAAAKPATAGGKA